MTNKPNIDKKPCFPHLRPEHHFKLEDKVACFIPENLEKALNPIPSRSAEFPPDVMVK